MRFGIQASKSLSRACFANAQGQTAPATFLEDLIDACIMECYFREHMAERDLLFLNTVTPVPVG